MLIFGPGWCHEFWGLTRWWNKLFVTTLRTFHQGKPIGISLTYPNLARKSCRSHSGTEVAQEDQFKSIWTRQWVFHAYIQSPLCSYLMLPEIGAHTLMTIACCLCVRLKLYFNLWNVIQKRCFTIFESWYKYQTSELKPDLLVQGKGWIEGLV